MNKPKNGKYNDIANRFWDNVSYVMKEKDMAWKDLAAILNIDPRTLASKKQQKNNVTLGAAKEIADAIGTSVDRLIYGNTEKY